MEEVLIVCCSTTALKICSDDVEMANSIVWTNLVPEGELYVIDKDAFLRWLETNGVKGGEA